MRRMEAFSFKRNSIWGMMTVKAGNEGLSKGKTKDFSVNRAEVEIEKLNMS